MRKVRSALSCGSVGASLLTDGVCGREDWFGWSQTAAFSSALNMACPNSGLLALGWESRANMRAGQCIGFALLGESLFPNAEKVTKNACPSIRVSLRSTSLTPSPLRGPAYKGHPYRWRPRPFTPLAASMPLAPLRADSIRPPERGVRRRLMVCWPEKNQSVLLWLVKSFHATRTPVPVRRPSAVAVEGVERHGCRESCDGPGMALRSVPPERRWSEGTLRAAKGRMLGSPSLWLLSLGETRESDAPCKAQPVVPAEESAAPDNTAYATIDHPTISIPPCPNRQRHALRINPEAASLPSRGDHP